MQQTVLHYLEESAVKYPHKIAVIDEQRRLSYTGLQDICRTVGSALAKRITPRSGVGIYLEKSIPAFCSMLGTLYAGCYYTTLNTELPQTRLQQIASVLHPALIITCQDLLPQAEKTFPEIPLVCIETLQEQEIDSAALREIRRKCIDTDPMYINFTSGSTGTPKGIVVAHRSVMDFIDCFTELFQITEEDVIANQAPFDFDVSVKDIYSSLKVGGTLLILPRHLFSEPMRLIDFLCVHRATTMIWAVSALSLISTFHALDYKTPFTVNKILFSGEVMPYKTLKNFRQHLPNATYVNLYGPTEITCNCTYYILQPEQSYENGIPIGKAFPNEEVFLLNEQNQKITEPNLPGELCVRGTALALGYYGSAEQNAKSFVQNPLCPAYPELIYRTGDLARYNENGDLVFCGRKDFQIKYMGHRIELEEIEREMLKVDGVTQCCCLFDEKKSRLRGFYVGTAEKEAVHECMKKDLPGYMIPGFLRRLDQMPLNKNGKTDRAKLKELAGVRR
ncbi:MAG TPA: amino acid adenylation domain-containing protein [Clostridiales bacterium]|nr:amino acid adenylation domain-containing protein [Clostridiales bacterium]